MRQLSITPSITVTIGRHTRLYFAYVTTAPAELDTPKTVTLRASTFADVVTYAAEPFTHDDRRGRAAGRLVLVEATERAWQGATYLGHRHLLLPADRACAGRKRLRRWLWRRLQAMPPVNEAAA